MKRRTGPFTIKRNIGDLIYKLNILRKFSRIYLVISIVHLKLALKNADRYNRKLLEPRLVKVEGDIENFKLYKVERIL